MWKIKLKSDKQIEEEQLKSKLYSKSNKINVAVDKMTYISETDNIAFLANNYDSDSLTYPNKILIVNMNDYSTVNTIKLSKDYTEYYYEKQGRFFYDDEYLVLINPLKEKCFGN